MKYYEEVDRVSISIVDQYIIMLQKGFLGKLANWVSGSVRNDPEAADKAAREFELQKLLGSAEDEEDKEKILGNFSEWLVFDHHSPVFNGQTGLQYFVQNDPLGLDEKELNGYRDLLSFEAGLFEVVEVESGRGVVLRSLHTGEDKFVHDVNSSLSLSPEVTVWGRIAPVDGRYYGVSHTFLVLPVKLGPGLRDDLAQGRKGAMDAREAAHFLLDNEESNETEIEQDDSDLDYNKARERFRQALVQTGMDRHFSVEQFESWVKNERKYGLEFANKVLIGLQPETKEQRKGMDKLISVAGDFVNRIPRSRFKGKTPAQMKKEIPEEQSRYTVDITSVDKYIKTAEKGGGYLAQADFENAYRQFQDAVKMLADDRMPFIGAFRLYANAAICCFHKGDGDLGEELFNAAIRLNPQYDFGIEQREKYLEYHNPSNWADFEELTKKQQKEVKEEYEAYRAKGKRRYERTPFVRYEKFLQEAGISLNFPTETLFNVYNFNESGQVESTPKAGSGINEQGKSSKKVGRNELCPCGSGRKYKNCCGK